MLLALTAALAIVVADHASVRATPRSTATELTVLWQGDVVEVRGEQEEYLKVYNYRRERGGYLRSEAVRQVTFTEASAPELLAVMRFLRDMPGSEALGISYAAAYLKAVPARSLTAEPLDAIGVMAERLADAATGGAGSSGPAGASWRGLGTTTASGSGSQFAAIGERLDVAAQFGVRMLSFERGGRMQVCYDGELYRRVLTMPIATAEQRAHAALGLTRSECIEPELSMTARVALDEERRDLLEGIQDAGLTAATRSRVHMRRAVAWAAIAFAQARRGQSALASGQRALAELTAVRPGDLGEMHQVEYVDSVVRVSAVRWAAVPVPVPVPVPAPVRVSVPVPAAANAVIPAALPATPLTTSGSATSLVQIGAFSLRTNITSEPGQTCVTLEDPRQKTTLARRCTYGIVWLASARPVAEAPAVVLSVQPLESWRELWVFHQLGGKWLIDVVSPGLDEPLAGYVDFAGYVPGTSRILLVRELKERSRFRRWFEVARLDDLVLVRQASSPELLRDFGRWQDARWRRETLAVR